MKKNWLIILFLLFYQTVFPQSEHEIYEQAFQKINGMLNNTCKLSFKEAVFTVENAYFSNQLDRTYFDKNIEFLTELAGKLIVSRDLLYNYPDKENVEKFAALFTL